MPETKPIDRDELRRLASEPGSTLKSVCAALGVHYSTLYTKLKTDAELKEIWEEARLAEKEARGGQPSVRTSRKGGKKKSSNSSAPPRNGNAKAHKDLFAKLALEFDHITLYGEVSEHFDELRDAVVAAA